MSSSTCGLLGNSLLGLTVANESRSMGKLGRCQRWPRYLLMVLVGLAIITQRAAAQQQSPSVLSAQLLPAPVKLVADWFDDNPTAVCTASNLVSVTVDALLTTPRAPPAPRTVVLLLSLETSQVLEATVFSTAGLQVVLFQQSGQHAG